MNGNTLLLGSFNNNSTETTNEINAALNSLVIYIGGNIHKTEVLSRLVYYKLSHVGHGKKDHLMIYVFLPVKNHHFLTKHFNTTLVLQNSIGKTLSKILELPKQPTMVTDETAIVMNQYFSPYKTGKELCWLVAECRSCGSSATVISKRLFKIGIFSKSIPYQLDLPSCWQNFVSLSREIHIRIGEGKEEKELLQNLLNIWECIFALNEEVEETNDMIVRFVSLHKAIPHGGNSKTILKSPLLMIMYIMFNCDRIPQWNELSVVMDKFEEFIDSLVREYNNTAANKKTMRFLMRRLFELDLIDLNFESIRRSLLMTLGGEMSKYICLLGSGGEKTMSSVSCFFQTRNILSSCQ